ncbi:hypothetical protein [Zhouia amylolytica]|uniref:hypothetical protein n=1 Tax=Zhouia amylolytica TaxID=376730 RepID=UPI0020CEE821|nr:hypothetical protein [Zhouia amylolytica]MCQ0111322.1 hypothetical protein [Zhouia amylolytica]
MKSLMTNKCKFFLAAFTLTAFVTYSQKQAKDFKESFNVNPEVSININTSYTDVEFETWDKNTVEVIGTIEVEGVSKEEANKIFKNWSFEAKGNSSEITISTQPAIHFASGNVMVFSDDQEFEFRIPELPEMPEMPEMPEVQAFSFRMPAMPPMPPMPMNMSDLEFDYEAYKKDGDKYLKAWKKEFNKNFDEDFKENLEAWKEDMKRYQEDREKMKVDREKMQEEIEKHRHEIAKVREEARKEIVIRRKEIAKERSEAEKARREAIIEWEGTRVRSNGDANTYFIRSKGGNENLKVKKTIKIKMPKGAKLKMNVRHGEVKIADATKNINATLSHTRLHAYQVDGEQTFIKASYSPIVVDHWNYGELNLNYVKNVDLKNVKSVKLSSKSSDVVIGTISKDAIINGSFGDLLIANVNPSFKNLSIILDNSDAIVNLPKTAFDFYCNATDSSIVYPKDMVLDVSNNYNSKMVKGYRAKKNGYKTVNIVATYSDIEVQ